MGLGFLTISRSDWFLSSKCHLSRRVCDNPYVNDDLELPTKQGVISDFSRAVTVARTAA